MRSNHPIVPSHPSTWGWGSHPSSYHCRCQETKEPKQSDLSFGVRNSWNPMTFVGLPDKKHRHLALWPTCQLWRKQVSCFHMCIFFRQIWTTSKNNFQLGSFYQERKNQDHMDDPEHHSLFGLELLEHANDISILEEIGHKILGVISTCLDKYALQNLQNLHK